MTKFNLYIVCGYISRNHSWIRLGTRGPGLTLKRTPPLFSERHRYRKTLTLWGNWRIGYLPAT